MREVSRMRIAMMAALVALLAVTQPLSGEAFKKAPPLSLPDLEGKTRQVDYHETPVTLVNFWATWCLPCREEMPQLDRLFQRYRDRGFRAVGVALQSGEGTEVRKFLKDRKLEVAYPILLGNDDVATDYGDVDVLPTSYLIGPKGEVLKSYFGVTGDFEKRLGADIEGFLNRPAAGAGEKKPAAPSGKTGTPSTDKP